MIASWLRRIPNLVAGALAGLAAAIVMTLAMVASRYWLGVMPLIEAVPDRVASLLSVQEFFRLFGQYGGYNGLKQFGILSGLRGVAATGLTVGVLYALVIESAPSRRTPRWLLGSNRPALLFMVGAILAVWIGFVIFLWPILPANYRGVPFTWARILTIVAMLAWFSLFAVTLVGSYRFMIRRIFVGRDSPTARTEQPIATASNRRAVVVAAASALLTIPITRLLDRMYHDATFSYDGRTFHRETITPITPTELFYSVTKNVVDPDVNAGLWRLEIGGHVRDARTYSLDDLQSFEQVDQETTLMCISNRVGSGLFGNAAWRGVRLRDLLDASGVEDGAFEVLVSGADGYSDSFAMDRALADVTLVVHEMNGEPLNRLHGGPARIIVPGLYGEKNVKWVTRVSVETEDKKGLYESQGWGPSFTPILRSDIFAPQTGGNDARGGWRFDEQFRANLPIEIKGRAFDPNLGIATVELSVDGGASWNPTEIYYPGTDITWSLWRFTWTPTAPGEYVLIPRATSKTGELQPGEATSIVPDGAQGYQKVTATVVA